MEFCPECGKMLMPNKGVVKCRCGYEKNLSEDDIYEFMDWFMELTDNSLKIKEVRELSKLAGYDKEKISAVWKRVSLNLNKGQDNLFSLLKRAICNDGKPKGDSDDMPLLTFYPIFVDCFSDKFSDRQMVALIKNALKNMRNNVDDAEVVAYVSHYFTKIQATPEDTRSTTYKRLLDMVLKNYDDYIPDIY